MFMAFQKPFSVACRYLFKFKNVINNFNYIFKYLYGMWVNILKAKYLTKITNIIKFKTKLIKKKKKNSIINSVVKRSVLNTFKANKIFKIIFEDSNTFRVTNLQVATQFL